MKRENLDHFTFLLHFQRNFHHLSAYRSNRFWRIQPSMISFTSGSFTLSKLAGLIPCTERKFSVLIPPHDSQNTWMLCAYETEVHIKIVYLNIKDNMVNSLCLLTAMFICKFLLKNLSGSIANIVRSFGDCDLQ